MKYTLIPSLIARTQTELETRLNKIKPLRPRIIQLDVMDGQFVPHTSLAFEFTLPAKIAFEAHLMMNEPHGWLIKNHKKIESALIHYESKAHIHDFIALARKYKKKIGIAINPETPAEDIAQYMPHIDKVLIMTVHPGKYGAPFIPATLAKIDRLKEMHPKLQIQVDGGITPKTLFACAEAGAHQFVIGSYLQQAKNVKQAWKELAKIIES